MYFTGDGGPATAPCRSTKDSGDDSDVRDAKIKQVAKVGVKFAEKFRNPSGAPTRYPSERCIFGIGFFRV